MLTVRKIIRSQIAGFGKEPPQRWWYLSEMEVCNNKVEINVVE